MEFKICRCREHMLHGIGQGSQSAIFAQNSGDEVLFFVDGGVKMLML